MLEETVRKFNRLRGSFHATVERSFFTNESSIINFIREDQLRQKGENSEGEIIGTYSPISEILSDGEKKAGEPFTFVDTFALYNSWQLNIVGNKVLIFPIDNKVGDLTSRYGDNIFKLSLENRGKVYEIIEKEVLIWIESTLKQ